MSNIRRYDVLPAYYEANFISKGDNGECYKIDENTVFKRLFLPHFFEDRVKKLSHVSSNTFIFPENLIYVKDKFIGYTMEHIDGTILDELDSIDINKYLKEIYNFEYNISVISAYKIYIFDFLMKNIMYTKDNRLKAIDTDCYRPVNEINGLYQTNLFLFSSTILDPMFNILNTNFNNRELEYHKELVTDGKYLASKFLSEIINELKRKFDLEINTTKDVRDNIVLIRK